MDNNYFMNHYDNSGAISDMWPSLGNEDSLDLTSINDLIGNGDHAFLNKTDEFFGSAMPPNSQELVLKESEIPGDMSTINLEPLHELGPGWDNLAPEYYPANSQPVGLDYGYQQYQVNEEPTSDIDFYTPDVQTMDANGAHNLNTHNMMPDLPSISNLSINESLSESSCSSPAPSTSGNKKSRVSLDNLSEGEKYKRVREQNNESSRNYRSKVKRKAKEAELEKITLEQKHEYLKSRVNNMEGILKVLKNAYDTQISHK